MFLVFGHVPNLVPKPCTTIACDTFDYTLSLVRRLSPCTNSCKQQKARLGQGNKVSYTVDIPCVSQCQGRRHAIPTFTASTNFWRLFPLLCTEWPVVSMEIALSHWSSRVRQVEGVRPATAKKSKMKLGGEEKRRDGINFSSKGIPAIGLTSLVSRALLNFPSLPVRK